VKPKLPAGPKQVKIGREVLYSRVPRHEACSVVGLRAWPSDYLRRLTLERPSDHRRRQLRHRADHESGATARYRRNAGYRVDYGGKGSNQAVGCARLGAQVSFVAKIGKDAFGAMALQLHRDEGIDVAHVEQTADAPTGVGFIIVESGSGHNCITIDPGANELLTAADISRCAAALDSTKVVLTQLEIPVAAAEAALARGRARGAVTILNPAPVRPLPPSLLRLVDILTPNETEARLLAGHSPDAAPGPGDKPEELAHELIRAGVKQVVMTLGETGALIVTESSSTRVPAIQVAAVDTTGAGDAFNAGLAVGLSEGESVPHSIALGITAASLSTEKRETLASYPYRPEVDQRLSEILEALR
jgi:ribokinase